MYLDGCLLQFNEDLSSGVYIVSVSGKGDIFKPMRLVKK